MSLDRRAPSQLSVAESGSGFRLRHLLALGLVGAGIAVLWPRGQATWKLHNEAVAYADYALCMVGPTGVEKLRDEPDDFQQLVRLRVINAMPDEQPLLRCQPLAEKLPISSEALRIHGMRAVDFDEYHNRPGHQGRTSLAALNVSTRPLEELADAAWPFVRSGYAPLMQASSHTREAAHPTPPPQPGLGSGLPAHRVLYRSTAAYGDTLVTAMGSGANTQVLLSKDGGVHFQSGGKRLAGDLYDRCVADDEGRAFTLTRLGSGERIVVSQGPGAAPQIAVLAEREQKVAGISCDHSALIAAIVDEPDDSGHRPASLKLCPFRMPCHEIEPPDLAGQSLYYPLDVARIGGDLVLARSSGGITRVTSSRDDGRSWTPWTVTYDAASNSLNLPAPFRLLAAGERVLLYGGGQGSESYPLLISEDHGASFSAPAHASGAAATTGQDAFAAADSN